MLIRFRVYLGLGLELGLWWRLGLEVRVWFR